MVKSAVSTSERAALPQRDANARGLDDGARSGEEGKSHRNQSRFAEHSEETGEGWGSRREQENLLVYQQLSGELLYILHALAHVPALEGTLHTACFGPPAAISCPGDYG